MAGKHVAELELAAGAFVELDVVLAGDGHTRAVGSEGVVRNGMVEKVVNFSGRHVCCCLVIESAIGGALYYCGCEV